MDPDFKWMSEENPLPLLERKWQQGGNLTVEEINFLNEARKKNPDIRIKESCRVLLAAIAGNYEGDPHVQRHMKLRTFAKFQARIFKTKPPNP
jgi:hypothetical protein